MERRFTVTRDLPRSRSLTLRPGAELRVPRPGADKPDVRVPLVFAVPALMLLAPAQAVAAVVTGTAQPNAVVWASPAVESATRSKRSYEMHNAHRSFVPEVLVVPPGSTVRFSNDDPFFH